ncbi:hypothetical protein [Tropicibacter sp. S64]|uniref:hypothetical protein n=1 Tax=Tropicibacter sp. S64 TaxID=3415122 RepID=UPI003C7EA657
MSFSDFASDPARPTRRQVLAAGAGFALLPAPLRAGAPERTVVDVDGEAALKAALAKAGPGTTLRLAPGVYPRVGFKGVRGAAGAPIVLTSADPENPARIERLRVSEGAFLGFERLVFDYSYASDHDYNFKAFSLTNVTDTVVTDCTFEGDTARGTGTSADGYGWAFCLGLTRCQRTVVQRNLFHGFTTGLICADCRHIQVLANRIHSMRVDGMNFSQTPDLRIEGNHISDFLTSPEDKGHRDMIQFWTMRTKRPTERVVIRRNLLNSGHGPWSQTIFFGNEEVDQKRAGREMFYRDVLIEENVIINAHIHGVRMTHAIGVTIRNNTLIRNRLSVGREKKPGLYVPTIWVNKRCENIEVLRNVAAEVPGARREGGWDVRDNALIQDRRRGVANHYDALFVNAIEGDPDDLRNFFYRKGGALDGAGLGASWLQPER